MIFSTPLKLGNMNPLQSIFSLFKNYLKFSGRTPRSGYWYAYLFFSILSATIFIIDLKLIGTVLYLITGFPFYALSARRLHDVGKSGWWQLIQITGIGCIPYIYWMCKKGTKGHNRFGSDPFETELRA